MVKVHDKAVSFMQRAVSPSQQLDSFKESFEMTKPAHTSGFVGMFGDGKLTDKEYQNLQHLLHEHFQPGKLEEEKVANHLEELAQITSQIKAINSQSVLLHGERIKKAQQLLRDYKEGAFTKWLIDTYGNRQTPYSMLQYYEFYVTLPKHIRPKIESMPRKAAYTLASRDGNPEKKIEIIEKYSGEKQSDVILLIQETFPAQNGLKKGKTVNAMTIESLSNLCSKLERRRDVLTQVELEQLQEIANRLLAVTHSP